MTRPPSLSALNVARSRAVAAHDPRDEIRGPDQLAEVLLGEAARASLADPHTVSHLIATMDEVSPGGYAYFVARTAHVDARVAEALASGVGQVVILGAGYDMRAHRFATTGVRMYEVDRNETLRDKQERLTLAGVVEPAELVRVPVDLVGASPLGALRAAGFDEASTTLFVWEGVSYYLPSQAVDGTLEFVSRSRPGSTIVFDAMLPQWMLPGRFGAERSRAAMVAMYPDEPLGFDLDPGAVDDFLSARDFETVEALQADELAARYTRLRDGGVVPVLDLFTLITARVAG